MTKEGILNTLAESILDMRIMSKEDLIVKIGFHLDEYVNLSTTEKESTETKLKNKKEELNNLNQMLLDYKNKEQTKVINPVLDKAIKNIGLMIERTKGEISILKTKIKQENKERALYMRHDENELFIKNLNSVIKERYGKEIMRELCAEARVQTEEELKLFKKN